MIEYKIDSDQQGAPDRLELMFAQLREKAAKQRRWQVILTKQDDGSAELSLTFPPIPKETQT